MATMRNPNAFGKHPVELPNSTPNAAPVSADHSPSLAEPMNEATAIEPRDRGVEEVESFFDLAIDELIALRTRAEADAIARAAGLILESEGRGGRVHVTGIGKSEHIARYVAALLSSTG